MKGSAIIAIATGLAATLVSAQLEKIPQCALSCALTSLGATGCQTSDIACICNASGFVTALTPCVQSACSAAEFEQTIQAAGELCLAASVTLSLPGAATTAATTAAPSSSAASMTEVPSSSVSVSTEVSTTVATVETTAAASTTMSTAVSVPTGGSNVTTTGPPTPSSTGSSASRNTIALGGLGAVLALVAALL